MWDKDVFIIVIVLEDEAVRDGYGITAICCIINGFAYPSP